MRRRKGGSIFLVDMDIDDEAARRARRALASGRFDAAESLLSSATDANERAYYAEALADWPGEPAFLERWTQINSNHAATVAAIQRLKWAWEARGGGYAGAVGADAWSEFARRLPDARNRLVAAAKRNTKDATVLPWLSWCARGLSEPELSTKAFAEAIRRQPTLRGAYSSALLSVSSQWFGSEDGAFEFAREHAFTAPHGIGAPCLVIEAHFYASESLRDEQNKSYWTQPAVRAEVEAAHQACTEQGFFGLNGLRSRHWLAYGLWKSGHFTAAAEHFQHLRVWNQWPWGGFRTGFNWLLNPFGRARKQSIRA
jgi:hypothetical protein